MQSLTPIDVEFYEHKFKELSDGLQQAADRLIPDAYQTEKEQLLQAKALVDSHVQGFNEVLNLCSEGVLFNESSIIVPMENYSNAKVIKTLWSCQDILSSIFMLNSDLTEYVSVLSVAHSLSEKELFNFMVLERKFSAISDDLEECSKLIMSVLTKLDGYNI